MASRTTDSEGDPRQNRAAHRDRLRLVPTGLAYVEPRARDLRPYPGWGILVIGSEEKTVIRGLNRAKRDGRNTTVIYTQDTPSDPTHTTH
jgi:hypothetical protein